MGTALIGPKKMYVGNQYIKSAASPSFVSAIQDIEDRADECHKKLVVLRLPQNLAVWGVLTGVVPQIEREITGRGYGSPAHVAAMLNLSKAASQVLDWIRISDKPFVPRRALKWGEPVS